eukprot:SAG22_NODE_760_length_7411_cov_2.903310_1_plen_537_part_00
METLKERRQASIVDVLQAQPAAPAGSALPPQLASIDKVWAGVSSVVENIYAELDKRLDQQQLALSTKLLGPGSPAGDVMDSFNKSRVKFKQNCAALLEAFAKEFTAAQLKYEKAVAAGKAGTSSKAQLQKLYQKYDKKLTELHNEHDEVVAKGNSVLDTEQFAVSLLKYWAEHDRVVRQVYNSLCDLDEALWSCTLDMCEEMAQIRALRQMLIDESQGCFNADGGFDPGGGYSVESQLLAVDEPAFSIPPPPKKVPPQSLGYAEQTLQRLGVPLDDGNASDDEAAAAAAAAAEDGAETVPVWVGEPQSSSRVMQGWLRKKSPAAGKGWQKRWFVLHPHSQRISYFKAQGAQEASGTIDLALLAACYTTTDVKHHGKGVKLMMLDRRTYYFLAYSKMASNRWVRAIMSVYHGGHGETGGRLGMQMAAAGGGGGGDDDDDDGAFDSDDPEDGNDDDNDGDEAVGGEIDPASASANAFQRMVAGREPAAAASGGGGGGDSNESEAAYRAEAAELTRRNQELQAEILELEAELAGAKRLA